MDFETSKENIQPLACGRSARQLEAALNPKSSQELLEERRQFEDEVVNYKGEDPLEPWFQYILWIEQSYPSGGKESGLEDVLIKCLLHFENDQRYFQDRRMIKLYIKYIDSQPNPQEYYQELYNQGLGTMVADLYICWAYYYDLCGNFEKAESVFRKGLDARAEPYDELDQAHKHFGYTMSQRILHQDEFSQQQFMTSLQERRQALTSLRHHKKRVGSIRTGTAVKSFNPGKIQVDAVKPGSSNSNIQSRVFEDENKDPNQILEDPAEIDLTSQSVVRSIIDSARKKENEVEPGPWGKAKMPGTKGKQPCDASAHELSFEILEDDSEEQSTVRIPLPTEPNNYIKGIKLESNHVPRNYPQKEWKTQICLEAELPNQVFPMYNKCFAYPNPEKEYSIEEYRGYKWYKDRKIENGTINRWDNVWGNDLSIGIRLYPNFAAKNNPQSEFKVERFINDGAINSENVKTVMNLEEIYPEGSEEYQIEEILFKRIENGQRKLRFDLEGTILMEEEMDETRIVTDAYGRKSIIPSRRSIAPRRSLYVQPTASHALPEPVVKQTVETSNSCREPQLKSPILSPPHGIFLAKFKSIHNDERNVVAPQVQDQDIFKAPAPGLTPSLSVESVKSKGFQIFEDDGDESACSPPNIGFGANETCSTQTFNLFIKPQSISTPKPAQKMRSCFIPEPNITPPEEALVPQEAAIVDSPEFDNVPGCTTQPKQLSTIMETTETNTVSSGATTSTKSSPELEGEHSKHPNFVKSVAFITPPTIPEECINAPNNVEAPKPTNSSSFKIREDTLPLINSMKMFEEKTETVPKTLFALKPPSIEDDLVSLFTKTPEKKAAGPLMSSKKMFEDKTETIRKTQLAPKPTAVDDDFVSFFTKTPERKAAGPLMSSMKMFEDKTETIPKTLLAPKPTAVDDDFVSFFTKTPEKKTAGPLMSSMKMFEDKTETIAKTLLAPKPTTVDDDFVSVFTKTPEKKTAGPLKQIGFEANDSTTFSKLRDFTLPRICEENKFADTVHQSKIKNESSKGNNSTSTMKDYIFPKIKDDSERSIKQEQKQASFMSDLFSKKSSTNDSIIPGFEDFNIKGTNKMTGLDSSDIKDNFKSLNDTKGSIRNVLPTFSSTTFNDRKTNEMTFSNSMLKRDISLVMPSLPTAEKSLNFIKPSESIPNVSQFAFPLPKDESVQNKSLRGTGGITEMSLNISRPVEMTPVSQFAFPFPKDVSFQNKSIKNSDGTERNMSRLIKSTPVKQFPVPATNNEYLQNKAAKNLSGPIQNESLKFNQSARMDQSMRANISAKDMQNATEQSRAETSRSGNSSSKKQLDFFEDNVRTEAFGLNVSAIKNSTFLPSYASPAINISQIQERSLHIKAEPDDSEGASSNTSKIPVLSRFSAIHKKQSALQQSDLQKNNKQQSHEVLKEPIDPAKGESNVLKPSSSDILPKLVKEEVVEDDAAVEDDLSIYFSKTLKTPSIRRHNWSDCDSEPLVEIDHFPPRVVDLDQTRQYIEAHMVDINVNPFDEKLKTAFLEHIDFYIYLEKLPSCSLVNKISALKKNDIVKASDCTFEILKIVAEGGYGTVFCARNKNTDQLYAVKQEKPPNLWEYYICLELKSRLNINVHPAFMDVEYSLIGQNSSLLISAYSKYGSLITVCNKVKRATTRNVDEYIVMLLASQMLTIIDHLHASNIIHADIKPDNFVLMSRLNLSSKIPVVQLIDFGVSIDLALFPPEQEFLYCSSDDNFKCIEMLENRPWTFQTDLFGLAGTIHVLLFGKYMTVQKQLIGWSHKSRIPRYFNKSIWDSIFNALLNIRDCNSMPNLQNLRAILDEEIVAREKIVKDKIKEFNIAIESQ